MTDFFDEAIEDMESAVTEDEGLIGADEWDPTEAGQALRGIFLKAEPKATNWGVGYTVVVKDIDTGVFVKVWCKRSMLKGQLLDAEPKPGKAIVFKYNGMKEAASGNDYHSYQVRAEASDPEYWRDLQAKAAAAQMAKDASAPPNTPTAAVDDLEAPY